MAFRDSVSRFEAPTYAALRFVAGFMMAFHGAQKLFGFLGPQAEVGTQVWIGGVIELVGGALVAVGLFTRIAAFILAGTMAVAYFQFHWKFQFDDYKFLPLVNQGEMAALYCFVFLFITARGPGIASLGRDRG